MSLAEQAKVVGVSVRTLYRLIRAPWDRWRVGTAVKWCGACGFDFWNLRIGGPEVKTVDWRRRTPKLDRAIRDILKMAGTPHDPAHIRKFADAISSLHPDP